MYSSWKDIKNALGIHDEGEAVDRANLIQDQYDDEIAAAYPLTPEGYTAAHRKFTELTNNSVTVDLGWYFAVRGGFYCVCLPKHEG